MEVVVTEDWLSISGTYAMVGYVMGSVESLDSTASK